MAGGAWRYEEWEDPSGSKRLSDWVKEQKHRKDRVKEDEEYYHGGYAGYLDYWADQGKEYRLDPNRDWKTKWVEAGYDSDQGRRDSRSAWFYRNDLYSWHDPANAMNWEEGVHAGTGRVKHDTDRSLNYHTTIEMLDLDAYNRDAWYKSGAKGLGLEGNKVGSIQDIYDIEDWYAGEISDRQKEAERKSQAQLDATNKQIELLQMQLDEARAPREIDVGGYQVAEGGVADYIAQLQDAWDQRSARDLGILSDRLYSDFDSRYGQAQSDFDSRYNQAQSDWGSRYDQQQRDWGDRYDRQTDLYDSRISDLTNQWGEQRSAYDMSLSNLNNQINEYNTYYKQQEENRLMQEQRSRTAAAYGNQGRANNPSVTGVKTQRGLTYPQRNRYGSSFKRSDMTITNKQLNI